jgi:hypothetical protein
MTHGERIAQIKTFVCGYCGRKVSKKKLFCNEVCKEKAKK